MYSRLKAVIIYNYLYLNIKLDSFVNPHNYGRCLISCYIEITSIIVYIQIRIRREFMVGILIDIAAVIVGSGAGLLLKKGINEKESKAVFALFILVLQGLRLMETRQ